MKASSISLPSEESLLLSLCRMHFNTEQRIKCVDFLQKVSDWDYFIRLANAHGVIALCWYNLNEICSGEKVPEKHLDILYKSYLASLSRNTHIFNHLNLVLGFAENETKVVLLKGLALEKTVYGQKGLRQMNDLDILVPLEKAIDLRKKLLKNGFESQPMISPLHEKILPTYGKHLPEMYKNGLSVEIHFKLFDQKGNAMTEAFIEKSNCIEINDKLVFIPETQLHFLYLIKHLDKHEKGGFAQIRLYTDLVVMLSEYQNVILNKSLFDYASEAGLERAVSEKLFILGEFWGIRDLKEWINIPDIPDREALISRFIQFLRNNDKKDTEDNRESLLKPMKELNGFRDKVLFIVGYLFPSVIFMKYRYKTKSPIKVFLYYPVRWAKLVKMVFGGGVF